MSEEQHVLSPEAELLAAQERLAAAKQKVAESERLKTEALATQIATQKAQREKEIFEEAERARAIQAHWAQKRQAEAEAKEAVRRKEEADRIALEQLLSKREEEERQSRAKQAELDRLSDEAFQMERDAERIQAEAVAAMHTATTKEVVTYDPDDPYANHPLRRFIKGVDPEPPVVAPAPVVQSTPEPQTWVVKKHGPGNNFVNSGSSFLLEKEIKKQTGIQANSQRLDLLSSQFDEADLMKALGIAVAEFRERPMSHDGLLFRLESLLLEAENVA